MAEPTDDLIADIEEDDDPESLPPLEKKYQKQMRQIVSKSRQKSHVNTSCKLMLLSHAYDTPGCKVVGLRTDDFNFASQRAIEAPGAKKDETGRANSGSELN